MGIQIFRVKTFSTYMTCTISTVYSGKQEHRAQALFNHSEDFVMFPDEATTSLCCWDARTAQRKQLLSLGKIFLWVKGLLRKLTS